MESSVGFYQLSTARMRNIRMAKLTAGPMTAATGATQASAAMAGSGVAPTMTGLGMG